MSPPQKSRENELYGRDSATRDAIDRLANRWTVLITFALEEGPTRFNSLKARFGVSSQVLTRLLRDLERDGLVQRVVYPEVPVRVEYSLTELGGTMCVPVHHVREWAEKVAADIVHARTVYDNAHETE